MAIKSNHLTFFDFLIQQVALSFYLHGPYIVHPTTCAEKTERVVVSLTTLFSNLCTSQHTNQIFKYTARLVDAPFVSYDDLKGNPGSS